MINQCRFNNPNYEGKHNACEVECPIFHCTCYRHNEICYSAKGTLKPDECWKCVNFQQEDIEPDEEIRGGRREYIGGGWIDKCKLNRKEFMKYGEVNCPKFRNQFKE